MTESGFWEVAAESRYTKGWPLTSCERIGKSARLAIHGVDCKVALATRRVDRRRGRVVQAEVECRVLLGNGVGETKAGIVKRW